VEITPVCADPPAALDEPGELDADAAADPVAPVN
jgi:hypothetical protein